MVYTTVSKNDPSCYNSRYNSFFAATMIHSLSLGFPPKIVQLLYLYCLMEIENYTNQYTVLNLVLTNIELSQ